MTVPIFRRGYDGAEIAAPSSLAQRHQLGGSGSDARSARADALPAHIAAADPHTGYLLESLLDAKGDLIAASADNTPARVAVGANMSFLMADSSQTPGVRWLPIQFFDVAASSDLVLTTTITDVSGATTGSFTTTFANARALCSSSVDFETTTAGTGFCNAYMNCSTPGTDDFAGAIEDRVHREWVSWSRMYTLATPGSYVIKLRGNKNTGGGASAIKINTKFLVVVIG